MFSRMIIHYNSRYNKRLSRYKIIVGCSAFLESFTSDILGTQNWTLFLRYNLMQACTVTVGGGSSPTNDLCYTTGVMK